MTQHMRQKVIEWGHLVVAASVITTVSAAIISFLLTVVVNLWGAAILNVLGVATAEEVKAIKDTARQEMVILNEKMDDLLRRIVVLARPEQIVHYRDLPEAVQGFCYAGEECSIVIFAERDPRALECKIMPSETRLLIVRDDRTYEIPSVNRGTAVNLGTSPRALEPRFIIPQSVGEAEVEAILSTEYTGCLWQTDGQPPVHQESPSFPIEVRVREEDQ